MLKKKGCYIMIRGGDPEYYNQILPTIEGVEDWSYQSISLLHYLRDRGVKDIMVSDKARLFFYHSAQIYAVSPNFINPFFYDKVSYIKSEAVTPYDPYSYLYADGMLMTCTLS